MVRGPPEWTRFAGRLLFVLINSASGFNLRVKSQSAMVVGPSKNARKFREVVKSSRNIIVIAGAGLSAASGDRPSKLLTSPFMTFTTYYL